MAKEPELEYAVFWRRCVTAFIGAFLPCILTFPLPGMLYGPDYWTDQRLVQGPAEFLIFWIFPAAIVLVFWAKKDATPGKIAIGARVVDESTGGKPSTGQLISRYFAHFISVLPLCPGFPWAGFDSRKQAWHDKLSGTVAFRRKAGRTEPVRFAHSDRDPSDVSRQ